PPSLSPVREAGIPRTGFRSFSNDLHQHSLASPAIELTVKDLLPRTEIQFTVADRHHDFASHYLPFYMRVGVVFSRIVVAILLDRLMRIQFLEPCRGLCVQSLCIMIDRDCRGDVHCL